MDVRPLPSEYTAGMSHYVMTESKPKLKTSYADSSIKGNPPCLPTLDEWLEFNRDLSRYRHAGGRESLRYIIPHRTIAHLEAIGLPGPSDCSTAIDDEEVRRTLLAHLIPQSQAEALQNISKLINKPCQTRARIMFKSFQNIHAKMMRISRLMTCKKSLKL